MGAITIVGDNEAINRIILGNTIPTKGEVPMLLEETGELILLYLSGENVDFGGINLVFPENLEYFYRTIVEIPYGETVSYSEVAKANGIHPRTVGLYLSKNPVPIIVPCHRVIGKNGTLGGFSAGIEWKKFLLHTEGITHIR